MQNIVFKEDGEAKVSITDVAKYSSVSTKGIIAAIRKDKEKFREINLSLPSDVTLKRTILNEKQATFLMTLLKNTAEVVQFKFDLVNQFFAMREIITNELCAVHERKEHDFEQQVFTLELKLQDATELRTYKEGRMSLRKYLKNRGLKKDIREDDAWEILVNKNIVQNVIIPTLRRGLIDSEYGLQTDIRKSPVFNPEKLDEIFLSDQMVFDYEELQDA